jgi:hypothetical protein
VTSAPRAGWLALATLLASSLPARSQQTPIERQQPCEQFSQSAAVFTGVAASPVTMRVRLPDHPPIPMRLSPVTVDRAYRGVTTPIVYVVPLGVDRPLSAGRRYLVYGRHYRPPDIVMASPGYGAREVASAARDLAFLDAMSPYARGGTLGGVVQVRESGRRHVPPSVTPLEGVTVTIRSDEYVGEAATGADGRFALAVPAGAYEVKAELPSDLIAWTGSSRIDAAIADGGCATLALDARFNGRVRGVLRGPDGMALSMTSVDLVPADVAPDSAGHIAGMGSVLTGDDGAFEFTGREPGRYLLGVNLYNAPNPWARSYPRTYYPGTTDREAARLVEVERGAASEGFDFALPSELPKGSATITVAAPRRGRPTLCLVQLDDSARRRTMLDVRSGVPNRQPVVAGLRYSVHAHLYYPGGHLESAPVEFTASTGGASVTLAPDRPRALHP